MNETVSALTDLLLAVECAILAWLLAGRATDDVVARRLGVALFTALGAGALLGGLVHGGIGGECSPLRPLLWRATLLALGAGAAASLALGARLCGVGSGRQLATLSTLAASLHAAIVLVGNVGFEVAAVALALGSLGLLVCCLVAAQRSGVPRLRLAAAGLALALAGVVVQQSGLAIHPRWFDHNALFHVIELGALVLLWFGIDAGLRQRPAERRPPC